MRDEIERSLFFHFTKSKSIWRKAYERRNTKVTFFSTLPKVNLFGERLGLLCCSNLYLACSCLIDGRARMEFIHVFFDIWQGENEIYSCFQMDHDKIDFKFWLKLILNREMIYFQKFYYKIKKFSTKIQIQHINYLKLLKFKINSEIKINYEFFSNKKSDI